ncbi:class I SAM-dependent DNA methyltransferase [Streptomyces sp. NPDC002795]|uniref:class I SAM-dependent DNA methyltransferase n=1 Tax=Streptomyces sp. NPDC002795 TaxID=3364665 RepID=UPI0036A190DB
MSESQDRIKRAHHLDGIPDRIDTYYGDWAASYDEDLRLTEYRGPAELGDLFGAVVDERPGAIGAGSVVLDAGCGTGLVAAVLARRGVTVIDGFDLSESMVAQARRTGVYRSLTAGVDMNKGLVEFADDTYDVTVSCGVFTLGHVPPAGLRGLLRVTKPGGLVVLSTFSKYLKDSGFVEYVQRQVDDGALKVVERRQDAPYTAEGPADYWVFEVLR